MESQGAKWDCLCTSYPLRLEWQRRGIWHCLHWKGPVGCHLYICLKQAFSEAQSPSGAHILLWQADFFFFSPGEWRGIFRIHHDAGSPCLEILLCGHQWKEAQVCGTKDDLLSFTLIPPSCFGWAGQQEQAQALRVSPEAVARWDWQCEGTAGRL